jgi:geranylgeranyl pyrophosphate synthase
MNARRAARTTPPKARRGRPSVHDESWTKVSVVLFDRQITQLDRILQRVKQPDGKRLTRASLIRALLDGLLEGGLQLDTRTTEMDLRDRVAGIIRGRR